MSEFDLKDHLTKTRTDGKVLGLMEAQTIVLQVALRLPKGSHQHTSAMTIERRIKEAIARHEAVSPEDRSDV